MATEDRTRHKRLRALMPRVYATEADTSALGSMLETLADLLRDADGDLERALRDKWLATAAGHRPPAVSDGDGDGESDAGDSLPGESLPSDGLPIIGLDGAPLPLELLGAALDIARQPWEVDHETYRSRIRIVAPLLVRGLGTPRVILAFALTSLRSEPCPVLEREEDATKAWGLPPGSLARCRTCRGGRVQAPGTQCPRRARAIMDATVTDNPRTRSKLRRRQLAPGAGTAEAGPLSARLGIRSNSLFSARPELVLRVPDDAPMPVVASFRSLDTGEELVVAKPLAAGTTLTIRPASPHDPQTPRHRQYWIDRPPGQAHAPARAWTVHTTASGQQVVGDLDGRVFLAKGSRFDAARFADDEDAGDAQVNGEVGKCAAVESRLDSLELRPGTNTWIYRPLDEDALADALADVPDGDIPIDPSVTLPAAPADTVVDVTLTWWTRPPARFRLRIPRLPAVKAALARGAADYLRHMIDRVRPAGVHPVIDFSEPPFPEPLEPGDALASVAVKLREPLSPEDGENVRHIETSLAPVELDPGDQAGFIGIFDVTRFDISRYSPLTVEPGEFDVTFFDYSLAGTLLVEPGMFDASYFDHSLANALEVEPGTLDNGYFDNATFAP